MLNCNIKYGLYGLVGLWLTLSNSVFADVTHNSVEFYVQTQAHSPAAPIKHWLSGFKSKPDKGAYAYQNSRMGITAGYKSWQLGYEIRRYDYLRFNPNTLDFYYALKQEKNMPNSSKLKLDVTSFNAKGILAAKSFASKRHQVQLRGYYYQIYDYQFASLTGISRGDKGISASANVDYIFSQDKLLDYQAQSKNGEGISVDIDYQLNINPDFTYQLELRDVFNRLWFAQAGFTQGCINIGKRAPAVCSGFAAASGKSGEKTYNTRIGVQANTAVNYQPYKLDAGMFYHQDIVYFYLNKYLHYTQHQFKIGINSDASLNFGWQWQGIKLFTRIDEYRLNKLRQLTLNAAYEIRW